MKNINRTSTSVHPSVSATTNIFDDKRQDGTYNSICYIKAPD